ncbi:MAG: hypothetical protein EXX96DRAFT_333624 [Benjaminiella poitrasii]|nr:MAG: hypothetical protein EXX96DRAFT_333624 [Benjaminiella poitrasii]
MYNKQCEAPSKPQNKHNDLRYTLELTAYDLINRFKSLKVDELCALKLSLSYIYSTLNENMTNTFKKNAIRNDQVRDEVSKAVELPELEDSNIVSDILKKFARDKPGKNTALIIICKRRSKVLSTTKNMLVLEVLEVLDYVVCNLEAWSELDSENSNETDYILAVYPIMNILLRSKKTLTSRSVEITSLVTKDIREYIKKVFNIDSTTTTYGRKLDVMVVSNESKVPLCAIEWKKQNVDKTKLLLQQAKNTRVNKCHLSHILKMNLIESEKKQAVVTGMDWRGLNGYMFGVKKVNNIYSSVLIGTLMISTHLKLVEEFEDTLVLLLRWRVHLY